MDSDSRNGGGGNDINSSRRNKRDDLAVGTGVAIGGSATASSGLSAALPEEEMDLGVGGARSSPNGSPGAIAPVSGGLCSGAARWFMLPLVEVLRLTDAGITRNYTGSRVGSRVPLPRITIVVWRLPATELTRGGFRWPESVNEINFGGAPSPPYENIGFYMTEEVLSLGEVFNRPLEPGWVPWPPGLKTIRFGCTWNIDRHGDRERWPPSLENIYIPSQFNQPLAGGGIELHRGLREIALGETFNQSLVEVDWPPMLQTLTVSLHFDQPLEGVRLPAELREIYLRGKFNRAISVVAWPKALEVLELGSCFNQPLVSRGVDGDAPISRKYPLPAALNHLHLDNSFNHPLSGHELPDGLEVLRLGPSFKFFPSVGWPTGLKKLFIRHEWDDLGLVGRSFVRGNVLVGLPPNLNTLEMGPLFNLPLTTVVFPPTLKVLGLGYTFNHPIGGEVGAVPLLPDGLEELRLGQMFNQNIENIRLPAGLKRLIVISGCRVVKRKICRFDRGLSGVIWPPGLEELVLGDKLNQSMKDTTFPKSLRRLSFGEAFTYSLQGAGLPDGLTHLSFDSHYPVALILALDWPRSMQHIGTRPVAPVG